MGRITIRGEHAEPGELVEKRLVDGHTYVTRIVSTAGVDGLSVDVVKHSNQCECIKYPGDFGPVGG